MRRLFEGLAENRARIETTTGELNRVRDSVHGMRSEVQAVRYLAEQVADLAGQLGRVADRVDAVATHALNRPTPAALGVFAQYGALVVAIIALVLAVQR